MTRFFFFLLVQSLYHYHYRPHHCPRHCPHHHHDHHRDHRNHYPSAGISRRKEKKAKKKRKKEKGKNERKVGFFFFCSKVLTIIRVKRYSLAPENIHIFTHYSFPLTRCLLFLYLSHFFFSLPPQKCTYEKKKGL